MLCTFRHRPVLSPTARMKCGRAGSGGGGGGGGGGGSGHPASRTGRLRRLQRQLQQLVDPCHVVDLDRAPQPGASAVSSKALVHDVPPRLRPRGDVAQVTAQVVEPAHASFVNGPGKWRSAMARRRRQRTGERHREGVEHHSAGRPPCGAGPGPPPDPATRKRPPPPKEVAAPRPGIH